MTLLTSMPVPRNVARDGPGPPPGDMTFVAPIILASVLLPLAIVVLAIILGTRQTRRKEELLRTGVPARARVVRLSPRGTTMTIGGQRHVGLDITVQVDGPAPYLATFAHPIAEQQIPFIQPGAVVDLRVDPSDPARVAFVGVVPQYVGQQGGYGQSPPVYGAPITAVAGPGPRSATPLIAVLAAIVGLLVVSAGVLVALAFAR